MVLSPSADITFNRDSNDELIFLASSNLAPLNFFKNIT
jgi:hypothetical protein